MVESLVKNNKYRKYRHHNDYSQCNYCGYVFKHDEVNWVVKELIGGDKTVRVCYCMDCH